MHNVKFYKNPDGSYQFRVFTNTFFDKEPVSKTKPLLITTPFFNTETCKYEVAPLEDTEYEIELKKEESIRCSLSRSARMIKYLALSYSDWKWFVTFTFDKLIVGDRYDYENISGYLQFFLKKFREDNPGCHYIVVPERHKDGAFHFHGLFDSNLKCTYAGLFNGHHTYHVKFYNFGFSSATKVKSILRVSHYISKYMTKELLTVSKFKKRYWHSKNTLKPIVPDQLSLNLLFVKDYLDLHGVSNYEKSVSCIKFIDFTLSEELIEGFIWFCSVHQYFFDP